MTLDICDGMEEQLQAIHTLPTQTLETLHSIEQGAQNPLSTNPIYVGRLSEILKTIESFKPNKSLEFLKAIQIIWKGDQRLNSQDYTNSFRV